MRAALIWLALALAVLVPILAAAGSPLLQWRDPIYIFAGFAGIVAMALMLVQPLLLSGLMPGVSGGLGSKLHRLVGLTLVLAVVVHVIGLWITSPPDVIDVLLFRSPTPFAVWGALAMWAVFGAALLAIFRTRIRLRIWRWAHTLLVCLAVVGTVVHAVQILGAMEPFTKYMLAAFVIIALSIPVYRRRLWATGLRKRKA